MDTVSIFGSRPQIEVAHYLWQVCTIKFFYLYLVKSGAHQLIDLSIDMTPIRHHSLDGRQSILPNLNLGLIAQPILYKEKSSARREHPIRFTQCFFNIRNAAQRPSAHHIVKASVWHR